MCQQEVFKTLEREGELTCKEISKKLQIGPAAVSRALTKLNEQMLIKIKKRSGRHGGYIYKLR